MQDDKRKALHAFLGQLPEEKALPLVTAIEIDRVAGESSLPHEDILDALRPTLTKAAVRPPRVPTPMRLFCDVFEDLIYDGLVPNKQRGRVERRSFKPIWDWLAVDLMPRVHADLSEKIRTHILARDPQKQEEAVGQLHEAAAEHMMRVLEGLEPGSKPYRDLAQRLGNSRIVEDARDIMWVLAAAPQMQQLRWLFPKPVTRISESDKVTLRRYYEFLSRHMPASLPSMFYVLLGRMSEPCLILRVAKSVCALETPGSLSRSRLAFLGNLLINEAENLAEHLQSIAAGARDMTGVLELLTAFSRLTQGLTHEIGPNEDREWSESIFECRAAVAGTVERLLESVPAAIETALPTVEVGTFGGRTALKADTSLWPDPDRVGLAMSKAAFLGATRVIAPQVSFTAAHSEVMERVSRHLIDYSDSIVARMRAGDVDERERITAHLETATRLTQYVLGETEADLLWQRGLAAA